MLKHIWRITAIVEARRRTWKASRFDSIGLVREVPIRPAGRYSGGRICRWLAARQAKDMAPRTRNSYLEVLKAFCNWCVQTDRLASNPLAKLRKADQQTDRRIVRRSMTEEELHRLLYVATWRPLAEFGRDMVAKDPSERKAKRDTWTLAPLTFDDLPAAVERARDKLKDNPAVSSPNSNAGDASGRWFTKRSFLPACGVANWLRSLLATCSLTGRWHTPRSKLRPQRTGRRRRYLCVTISLPTCRAGWPTSRKPSMGRRCR